MNQPFLTLTSLLAMAAVGVAQTATSAPIDPFAAPASESTPAPAPTEAAPVLSGDEAKIVEKLALVQKEFELKKKEIANTALGRYTSAAQSELAAAQFYITCQQMVSSRIPDLDGVSKKDAKDKEDKTKRQADMIESTPGYAAILQMQLQYLVFTMEAPTMKDRGALMSKMRDFAGKAATLVQTYGGPPVQRRQTTNSNSNNSRREQEKQREEQQLQRGKQQVLQLAKASPLNSVFAQAFNLQNYFKAMDNWPDSPLNLQEVFPGMIIPFRYDNKPELLASEWDEFLRLETMVQHSSLDETAYARWLIGSYRSLEWQKWLDLLAHGTHRIAAADELARLIKDNPTHPAVGSWADSLTEIMETIKNPPAKIEPAAEPGTN